VSDSQKWEWVSDNSVELRKYKTIYVKQLTTHYSLLTTKRDPHALPAAPNTCACRLLFSLQPYLARKS
jgi:hypothetical protein